MAKKHDERRVLASLYRNNAVDVVGCHIIIKKNATVGIHTWGKIDFLAHYCGYFVKKES